MRMRKRFFRFLVILINFLVFASDFSFAKIFELSVSGGIRNSKVQEFVFQDDYTLSQLDWNAPLIPVLNVAGRFDIFHVLVDLSVNSAIPVKLGSMQDYDWLGQDKSKYTNFSSHELILNKLYDLEAKVGYDFNLKNFGVSVDLSIIPQAGFLYRNQKFEAYNGYTQYATSGEYWSDSIEKKYLSGSSLTYEVASYMPFLSLETEYKIDFSWCLKLFGRYFPYIYAVAIDNHYLRPAQFNDYMEKGLGFSIGTEVSWKKLSFSFCYEWFKCEKGKTQIRTIGDKNDFIDSSTIPGVESSVISLMFSYKI